MKIIQFLLPVLMLTAFCGCSNPVNNEEKIKDVIHGYMESIKKEDSDAMRSYETQEFAKSDILEEFTAGFSGMDPDQTHTKQLQQFGLSILKEAFQNYSIETIEIEDDSAFAVLQCDGIELGTDQMAEVSYSVGEQLGNEWAVMHADDLEQMISESEEDNILQWYVSSVLEYFLDNPDEYVSRMKEQLDIVERQAAFELVLQDGAWKINGFSIEN